MRKINTNFRNASFGGGGKEKKKRKEKAFGSE
jgi:hypothetical protein